MSKKAKDAKKRLKVNKPTRSYKKGKKKMVVVIDPKTGKKEVDTLWSKRFWSQHQ